MIEKRVLIGEEYPLKGLLTFPDSKTAPFPAIVLVHGSGSHDMDETIYKVKPFKDLAAGLAEHGIATLRYDKRSKIYGKKMVKALGSSMTVKEEAIEDAIFAADLLRKDPRIDPNRIYIAGHSLGGALAPRIDKEGGNFAGLIIMAGSPRKLEEIVKKQGTDYLKNAKGIIKWIATKQINKMAQKLTNIYDLTDEEAKNTPFAGGTSLYYLKEMGENASMDYLATIDKPVFVIQGEMDVQVLVKEDFEGYKEILADNPHATFKLYPNLNHCFMPTTNQDITKALKEYKKEQHVEPYVIADIAEWVKGQGEAE